MRIVIGNLPDEVSEEGIREGLRPFASAETIQLPAPAAGPWVCWDRTRSGGEDRLSANR